MHYCATRSGHGVIIYSKSPIVNIINYVNIIEVVAGIVNNVLVLSLYIPPSTPWFKLKTCLNDLLSHCTRIMNEFSCANIIITGDFNYDLSKCSNNLLDLSNSYSLIQSVRCPTHINGGILDLFISNFKNVSLCVEPVYFSDHSLLIASVQ